MKPTFSAEEIEKTVGYVFKDKSLLADAFTHKTYREKYGGNDNERLEFLGDAVIELIVSEELYHKEGVGKIYSEGTMTEIRKKVVCNDTLFTVSKSLGLEKHLRFYGKKENVGDKAIASLIETLTAAIYLDGGYIPAKQFVCSVLKGAGKEEINYIGALKERLEKEGISPKYAEEKTGEDHAPTFFATVSAKGKSATGQGKSKKDAKADAAKKLLEILEVR